MKKYLYLILFFLVCVPAIAGTIDSYTEKNPPESGDFFVVSDGDDGSTKKVNVGNLPSTSINWSSYSDLTSLSNSKEFLVNDSGTSKSINWEVFQTQISSTGINWSAYPDLTSLTNAQEFLINNGGTSSSINWQTFQTLISAGINWSAYPEITSLSNANDFIVNVSGTTSAINWETFQSQFSSVGGWTDSGTNVYVSTSTDKVGIGTSSPAGRLTIKGQNTHFLGCSDSIQTTIDGATAGDTIILGSCTYTLSAAITSTKSIRIIGQGVNATTITQPADAGAFSFTGASNVLLSNFSITGSDGASSIAFADGNGSADDPDNIWVKGISIIVSLDGGGTAITFNNSSGYVDDVYINYTNTDGGTSSEQLRGVVLNTNGASGSGSTTNSEANEDHVVVIRNSTIITNDSSGSWNGGRIRSAYNWMNSSDTTQYNSTMYIYDSYLKSYVLSPAGTSNYGTEAGSVQGPNAAYSVGVTGLVSTYFYNSMLDGGEANPNQSTGARDLRCDDYAECHLDNTTLRRQEIQTNNNGTVYRKGVLNASGLYSAHSEEASVFLSGQPGIYAIGQDAGEEQQSGARTGKTGGTNRIEGGDGNIATGTDAAKTGGSGGSNHIIGGDGADQSNAAPTNNGGVGGLVNINGGTGGDSTGGTNNNGGDGGGVYLRGGVAGTGATSNGESGHVYLGLDSTGLLNGNVGVGTTLSPGSKLSVFGGVSVGSSTYARTESPSNGLIVSGNVGVGTLSPSQKLEVSGALKATDFYSGDGTQGTTTTCSTSITAITIKDGLITSITCP